MKAEGMKQQWAKFAATVFYVGYLKPAPGTWGSLAALPLGYLIFVIGGVPLFALAIPLAYFAGVFATNIMTEGADDHDPLSLIHI